MISSIALKCQKYCRWQTRKIYDGLKFVRLAKNKKKMVGYNLFSFESKGVRKEANRVTQYPTWFALLTDICVPFKINYPLIAFFPSRSLVLRLPKMCTMESNSPENARKN